MAAFELHRMIEAIALAGVRTAKLVGPVATGAVMAGAASGRKQAKATPRGKRQNATKPTPRRKAKVYKNQVEWAMLNAEKLIVVQNWQNGEVGGTARKAFFTTDGTVIVLADD